MSQAFSMNDYDMDIQDINAILKMPLYDGVMDDSDFIKDDLWDADDPCALPEVRTFYFAQGKVKSYRKPPSRRNSIPFFHCFLGKHAVLDHGRSYPFFEP